MFPIIVTGNKADLIRDDDMDDILRNQEGTIKQWCVKMNIPYIRTRYAAPNTRPALHTIVSHPQSHISAKSNINVSEAFEMLTEQMLLRSLWEQSRDRQSDGGVSGTIEPCNPVQPRQCGC